MFRSSVARSYARGLVGSVARGAAAKATLDGLATEFRELTDLLRTHPELKALLANPGIGAIKRAEIAAEVLQSAGASPTMRGFVTLVVGNGHAAGLEAIGSFLDREVAAAQGIVEAEVRVAKPIGDEETNLITAALRKALGGREVRPHVTVDPSLIGGFVASAGDLVFDGSIAHQLARLRAELVRR